MSRRASNHHQSKYTRSDHHNPYQVTTLSHPKYSHPNHHHHHQRKHGRHYQHNQPHYQQQQTSIDIGFSDATTTDTCYEYCEQDGVAARHNPLRESRNTFSDESESTMLPYYEIDEDSNAGTRNSVSEQSFRHSVRYQRRDEAEEQLYHEIQTPCEVVANGRRLAHSRQSDRPQSSMSSALTNGMVYGCGGKCQTFESVCYFVLQLFFTMGVLIGVSLCIAGLVLRKSAARNLQVLVYIGIMLATVSAVLLTVQCRAKNTAKRRIKAIQTAKRAPLQMETLNIRSNPVQKLERLTSIRENQKVICQLPQVHHPVVPPLPQRYSGKTDGKPFTEEEGIPWWKRRDVIL